MLNKSTIEMKGAKEEIELSFGNFFDVTKESYKAIIGKGFVPKSPMNYKDLKEKLHSCSEDFPQVYRKRYIDPFAATLDQYGESEVNACLDNYAEKCDPAIIAQPIVQRCDGFEQIATDAFQEVVSDLYDGFLSAEDREKIKPPDYCVVAPLIRWLPSLEWTENTWLMPTGPSTNPAKDFSKYWGIKTGIVNLPIQFAKHGIFAWASLGHETAGHDILSADEGLIEELAASVRKELLKKNFDPFLAEYWNRCLEETASDIMGIRNMGLAVGMATIGFFRAYSARYKGEFKLDNLGYDAAFDPGGHPADILRGYLAASVASNLNFNGADNWAKVIRDETDKDLDTIRLEVVPGDPNSGKVIDPDEAKKSVEIIAETIMNRRMKSLEDHALSEIQNWKDDDERIVKELKSHFRFLSPIKGIFTEGIYAAHFVAAAVIAALEGEEDLDSIFGTMLSLLKFMHDMNPVWKLPIYLEHPGDFVMIHKSRYYDRQW